MPRGVYPRTENQRRASRARMKRLWQDPDTRARWSQAAHDRAVVGNFADPAFQKRIKPKIAALNRDPNKRAKVSAAQAKVWADPARRARRSAEMTRRMADPEQRATAVAAAARGKVKLHGTFSCPRRLKKLYRKLKRAIGVEAARREIRRLNAEQLLGIAA